MVEIARLLLYNDSEFFAEKFNGKIRLLETEFSEEEIPEEALSRKARESWGVSPEDLKLLCVLPLQNGDFVHYYSCKTWSGSFENSEAEEIVALDFREMTELSEKSDILSIEVLEKSVLGREFKKPSTIVVSQAHREIDEEVDDILKQQRKPIVLQHESTSDFEIMPAVPKGQGRKSLEPTREGIDFEFLSRGKKNEPEQRFATLEPSSKQQRPAPKKSVFARP